MCGESENGKRLNEMFQLAKEFMGDESDQIYGELAETMRDNGRLKDAEQACINLN